MSICLGCAASLLQPEGKTILRHCGDCVENNPYTRSKLSDEKIALAEYELCGNTYVLKESKADEIGRMM